jgi:para-nitrobenzyl esterase
MNKSRLALVLVIVIVIAVLMLWRSGEKEILPNLADADSLRQTPSGDVVGFSDQYQTHAWLGIPYAKAPTGDRRWRAPLPLDPWQGTLEALAYSPPCTQLWGQVSGIDDGNDGDVVGDEDCLYLNIWAPAFAPGEIAVAGSGLPVMVWIHGGGNTIGTANTYQGHHLAASQQVIYVGINYRLGMLGWFSHEALRTDAANALDSSGNYGILDMIAALEWVRDNIASFGGDPDNVTIFGESAGGRNVYALVGSPLAAGLFHRAISQSGSMQTSPLARAENLADAEVPGDANSSSEVLASLLQADGGAANRDEALGNKKLSLPKNPQRALQHHGRATVRHVPDTAKLSRRHRTATGVTAATLW